MKFEAYYICQGKIMRHALVTAVSYSLCYNVDEGKSEQTNSWVEAPWKHLKIILITEKKLFTFNFIKQKVNYQMTNKRHSQTLTYVITASSFISCYLVDIVVKYRFRKIFI